MEISRFGIGKSAEPGLCGSFADAQSIALSIAGDESNPQRKTNSGSQGHAESEIDSGSEAPNDDKTTGAKSDDHAAAVATAN